MIVLVALLPLVQGCNAVAYAPAMVGGLIAMGNRDLGSTSKHWSHIGKGKDYRTLRPVWVCESTGLPGTSPWRAYQTRPQADSLRNCTRLEPGTILRPNRIRYISDGLNYTYYHHHAIVQSGPLAGTEIQIDRLLLKWRESDPRAIDPAWLAPVEVNTSSGD